MPFERDIIRERAAGLAQRGVYLGTSSWKYHGWSGQLYDEARYVHRGKFAESRFERHPPHNSSAFYSENRSLQRAHKQLERMDLVILHELGYVPFSKTGAELLFEVVSRAYEQTSLILTTHLPFEQWIEVMGSERLTGAMLDRLTHRVHILEANGSSYRLQDAKKRLKSRPGAGSQKDLDRRGAS